MAKPLFFAFSVFALGLVSFITQARVGSSANRTRSAPTERLLPGRSENAFAHRYKPKPRLGSHVLVSRNGWNVSLCTLYGQKDQADAVTDEWKPQSGFERQVHAHSRASGAPIVQGGSFPVVFLEHGTGVVPSIYTVLAEGLASMGFVVAAINHTPDSLISVFPDGHEVKFKPYWPNDADRRTQGAGNG